VAFPGIKEALCGSPGKGKPALEKEWGRVGGEEQGKVEKERAATLLFFGNLVSSRSKQRAPAIHK